MKTEMFRFETAQFVIRAVIVPDDDVDCSFDETGETQEKLARGEWEAFGTIVTVETADGVELGSSALLGSIYANPADFFKEHVGLAAKGRADGCNYGSYFPQMVREAIQEARKTIRTIAATSKPRNLAESLSSYVSEDDASLPRRDFLFAVATRILDDLNIEHGLS